MTASTGLSRHASSGSRDDRPNVLFVMVDALRADRVYGDDRSCLTPFLDGIRSQSTAFLNAFSVASTTPICVASMLTGTYPFIHGVRSLINCRMRGDLQTLPEAFREAGYRTWAEATGPLLALTDMDRGFDDYRCRPTSEWLDAGFARVLEGRIAQPGPWFGFVHLWEIHHPRRVTEGFTGTDSGRTAYDRAVSSLDAQLARVLGGLPEDTVLIITSDHGEHVSVSEGDTLRRLKRVFRVVKRAIPAARRLRRSTPKVFRTIDQLRGREEGLFLDWLGHGYHVYDYLTRVPLLIRGAGFPPGKETQMLASHVDLLPTLAAACGLTLRDPGTLQGMNVADGLGDSSTSDRSLYLEAVGMKTEAGPEQRVTGLRTERYKYAAHLAAEDPLEELYDLVADPDERRNVAGERVEVAAAMKADLLALMEASPGSGASSAPAYSDEERAQVEARLRDLGYLD